MSSKQPSSGPPSRGKRRQLLLQQQLNELAFWPCILILAVGGALLVWNPVKLETYRPHLIVVLVGTGLILLLTFAFRLTAYVQCRAEGLLVRLPFYHLVIPYHEIKATRPTELAHMFPPEQVRMAQRRFLRSLLVRTVVVVELNQLPQRYSWLRLWMSSYMLCPETVGLVLLVDDWIALRQELDEFATRRRHA